MVISRRDLCTLWLIGAWGLGCSGDDSAPQMPQPSCLLDTIQGGGNCGCDLQLPIDTTQLTGSNLLWPFGVHGGGHPEGHRGWDFLSDQVQNIVAPANGEIRYLDPSVHDEDPQGYGVYLALECGLVVSFQPMRLAPGLGVGSTVARGQVIGTLSPVVFGGYSLHFDTRTRTSNPPDGTICPSSFFGAPVNAAVTALIVGAHYPEKTAHTVALACDDQTIRNLDFPAESAICNAHASAANLAIFAACIPSRADTMGYW